MHCTVEADQHIITLRFKAAAADHNQCVVVSHDKYERTSWRKRRRQCNQSPLKAGVSARPHYTRAHLIDQSTVHNELRQAVTVFDVYGVLTIVDRIIVYKRVYDATDKREYLRIY